MRVRLHSSTDTADHAIFDSTLPGRYPPQTTKAPSAVADRGGIAQAVTEEDQYEYLSRLTEARVILGYSDGSDGSIGIQVLIDEPPDEILASRQFGLVENLCLPVPSGRLIACGAEYLHTTTSRKSDETENLGFAHMGSEAAIPSGNYRCTAFNVHFSQSEAEKFFGAPGDAQLRRMILWSELSTGTGCFCMFMALVSALVAFSWPEQTLYYCAALLLMFGLACLWLFQYPTARTGLLAARQTLQAHAPPDVVLVLKRIEDVFDPQDFAPGKIGPCVTGSWGPEENPQA